MGSAATKNKKLCEEKILERARLSYRYEAAQQIEDNIIPNNESRRLRTKNKKKIIYRTNTNNQIECYHHHFDISNNSEFPLRDDIFLSGVKRSSCNIDEKFMKDSYRSIGAVGGINSHGDMKVMKESYYSIHGGIGDRIIKGSYNSIGNGNGGGNHRSGDNHGDGNHGGGNHGSIDKEEMNENIMMDNEMKDKYEDKMKMSRSNQQQQEKEEKEDKEEDKEEEEEEEDKEEEEEESKSELSEEMYEDNEENEEEEIYEDEEQYLDYEYDFENISVAPITPRSQLSYTYDTIDHETKIELERLIQRQDIQAIKGLINKMKVYIHSQIPLDDEHAMEEKSYKIETLEFDDNIIDNNNNTNNRSNNGFYNEDIERYALSKHPLYQVGVAVSSKKGNTNQPQNQDNYFIYIDPHTKYISLFDGHGPCGNSISFHCCIQMAKNILQDRLYLLNPLVSLQNAYHKMKYQIKAMIRSKECPFDTHLSGTSTTTVIIRENWLHIAHLGDIKIMKGRKHPSKKSLSLELLTNDHIPSQMEEKRRIYKYGGEVRKLQNDYTERIFVKGRMFPNLTVSRSFGDDIGSLIGVINEPDIFSVEITDQDLFVLIGTDPVFSNLDDSEILNIMNYANKSKIKDSVDMLIKRAKNAWLENDDSNDYDDMTLVCVFF